MEDNSKNKYQYTYTLSMRIKDSQRGMTQKYAYFHQFSMNEDVDQLIKAVMARIIEDFKDSKEATQFVKTVSFCVFFD